jgi:hypothetical protein
MSNTIISTRCVVQRPKVRFAPMPSVKNVASSSPRYSVSNKTVHLFLDFSNVMINAREIANERSGRILPDGDIKINFYNLKLLAGKNRKWGSGYAAAGLKNPDAIRNECARVGIDFEAYERGETSGREQGIDAIIQGRMFKLATMNSTNQVAVLITGDGNGFHRNEGFIEPLKALQQKGFDVEVYSWERCFNSSLRDWAEHHGKAMLLDEFFDCLIVAPGTSSINRKEFYRRLTALV